MTKIRKLAVLASGGDAPGMNSAIRAVVCAAAREGIEVVGVLRGYDGLIDWETCTLGMDDVRNVNNQGGTILFTSRSERFLEKSYRERAADNLRKHGVDAVVAVGGDGTLRGAIAFRGENVNIVCIPGTIDRDVSCTEYTLGFDTAANTAMEAIDRIRDSSISHGRCSVVEVMGRKRGYIALWSGMAASADAIVLPEKWNGDFDSITDAVKKKHADGRNSYLVVSWDISKMVKASHKQIALSILVVAAAFECCIMLGYIGAVVYYAVFIIFTLFCVKKAKNKYGITGR